MPEQALSTGQGPSDDESREIAELREELAQSREEVLRLRDLLIGKDAELGSLRGRLAELEDRSLRFINAAARLQARIPKFLWTAGAGVRRARGRRT